MLNFHNDVEVDRHFKLLIITTLNQPLWSYKSEDHHAHVLIFSVLVNVSRRNIGGGTDKLMHIDPHHVELIDQDLIYLQLVLQLVLKLVVIKAHLFSTLLLSGAHFWKLKRLPMCGFNAYLFIFQLQDLNFSFLALPDTYKPLNFYLLPIYLLFAQVDGLLELFNLLALLLVLLESLLQLLSFIHHLHLQCLVLCRVDAGLRFLIQPKLLHSKDLLRVGLQFDLIFLQLGELESPL